MAEIFTPPEDRDLDGGLANSIYLAEQAVDGGDANS